MEKYRKQVIIELDPELARALEKVAPARSRRRSEFLRAAIRKAIWSHEERRTAEAYARQPDTCDGAYFDPGAWEQGAWEEGAWGGGVRDAGPAAASPAAFPAAARAKGVTSVASPSRRGRTRERASKSRPSGPHTGARQRRKR